jgi:SSS family solute:Na+ symporter
VRFTIIDWFLLATPLLISVAAVWRVRGLSRSVADFLAADRCAGRYLLCVGDGMAGLGLITIVAAFEMYYDAGFTAAWWSLMTSPASLVIALSGWVVYRFRKTRALTLAQFFEVRYSRRFRVFAGILAWLAGIINFAIFPSVGARFFIEFLGLPRSFSIAGLPVDVYTLLIISMVGAAVSLVFMAGQVAVMVIDFLLGLLTSRCSSRCCCCSRSRSTGTR